MIFEVDTLANGYKHIAQMILAAGAEVAPRGEKTKEILDAIIITQPCDTMPTGWGRGVVPAIGVVEALQLIAGISDPELTTAVAPNMAQFMDRGAFWGAYGPRLQSTEQVLRAVQKLRNDRDSRQAVLTLWDPSKDNVTGKHDYPCTISLIFTLRNDKLNLHVTMRSNDVWWGLSYDAFQFTQLQFTVARVLDVEVGQYRHHAVSLHAYERDFEKIENLAQARATDPTVYSWTGIKADSWHQAQQRARMMLRNEAPSGISIHEKILLNQLKPAFDELDRRVAS